MTLQKWLRSLICALCIFTAAYSPAEWAPGFAMPAALAEEDERNLLEIHVAAKPGEMVEPGDVMLSFTIENISDTDAQNIYLSSADGLLSEPVGRIAVGEQQSFNRQHSVTAEELDDGKVSYIISHDDPFDPNGKVNYTAHAEIRRSDVKPQVEFTRRFSSLSVKENSTLTITYRVRNTGNVALRDLRVQDSLGDYTGGIDSLDVGESRTLISRATITEETTSSAMLDYRAVGIEDTLFTQALSDASISIAQTDLRADLHAGYSPFSGDTADVVLSLENTGNTDIRDVRVTDETYGGVIADSRAIPAGQQMEISRSYVLRDEMSFRWKITGMSDSGEEIILYASADSLAQVQGESAALSLNASTGTPRIRRSGNVEVAVQISNPGGMDAQDVLLSEAELGEMYTFAVIPAGGSVQRSFRFDVSENTAYHFSIAYMNADGTTQSITAAPVEIAIAADGVLPEGATTSFIEFTGTSIKIGGSSIFAALLISGLGVLLVLIVLLLIASRRARIQKQLRIAAEKQRRREEMGKTNRFTPVRAPKNKAKGR